MTAALQPKQAERLSRILGMLGSAHPGEAANAAALASRMLREAGLTWSDLLRQRPPAAPEPPPRPIGHRARALAALWRGAALSRWERAFLHSVAGQPRLSAKQAAVLARIEKAIGGG